MEKQLDFCSTLSGESILGDEHSTHMDTCPLKHTGTHMLRAPNFKNKTKHKKTLKKQKRFG